MSLNSLQSERNICEGGDEGRFWKPTCPGLHLDFHLLVDLRFFIWGRGSLHSQHSAGDLVRAEGVRERMFVLCLSCAWCSFCGFYRWPHFTNERVESQRKVTDRPTDRLRPRSGVVSSSRLPVCGDLFIFPTKPCFYPQVTCCLLYSEPSLRGAIACCGLLSIVPNSTCLEHSGHFQNVLWVCMPSGECV